MLEASGVYVEASLLLRIASRTAEPKAPPTARVEKARTVAVGRKA